MIPSIRHKMVMLMVAVLAVSFTLAGWWTLHDQKQAILQETRARGEDLASLIARNMAPLVVGYNYQAIKLALREYEKLPDIAYARVVSQRGNLMGETSGKQPDNPALIFEKPIIFDGKQIGKLFVGLNNEAIIVKMKKEQKNLVWRESLLALLIAVAEFLALSYLVVRPLTTIANSLQRNLDKDGQLQADIPISSADEFGLIARLFNGLRAKLNEAHGLLNAKVDVANTKLVHANERLEAQALTLRKMNEDLTQIAITDPVTLLYNRRHFDDVLTEELNICSRYGDTHVLIMADIDKFKIVNDRYGHDAGDQVLRIMADRIREQVRSTDIIFRLGGEEFGILCRRANGGMGLKIAEKLRLAIAGTPFLVNDLAIEVTASFGVTEMTATQSVHDVYHHADAALYRSKHEGRNRVTLDEEDLVSGAHRG